MRNHHYLLIAIALLAGYAIAGYFPQLGKMSKLPGWGAS
jgi:hypothetical protein